MADPSAANIAHPGHPDVTKRDFLMLVTGAAAGLGAVAAAWPFIDYMNPSKDVLALSAIDVDLTPIVVGQGITVLWQGQPIFVRQQLREPASEYPIASDDENLEPRRRHRRKRSAWRGSGR